MEQTIPKLRYLHYGLAAVLGFAAFKMMANEWVHIPPLVSVGAIVAALSLAILASLHARRESRHQRVSGPATPDKPAL